MSQFASKVAVAAAALAFLALPAAAHADPFTDSGTWTALSGSVSLSQGDYGYQLAPGTSTLYNTASPAGADYKVEADFYTGFFYDWHGQQAASSLVCRYNPSTGDGYSFGYDSDTGEWSISGGSAEASEADYFVWDTVKHVEAICDGTSLTLKVDGVTMVSTTDSDITSAGKAAFVMENGGVLATEQDTRGIQLGPVSGTDL
jgi:hypothetical protein